MVLYVKDKTGRFSERPHFKAEELDEECEKLICSFLQAKYGEVRFPVDTEDLKSLIERDAHELDCYADLSEYGADVEGVTEFRPGKKPIVRISGRLTESERHENRLRTTLTHEYGHVRFHTYLFSLNQDQGQLFQSNAPQRLISKRENIIDAPVTDWMEWQAGYVCGAILMPATYVRKLADDFVKIHNHFGPMSPQGDKGRDIMNLVVQEFRVSLEAARVRLLKLGILGQERGPALFS